MNKPVVEFPAPTYGLLIGSKLIVDILNPKPEELDLPAIDSALYRIKRFSARRDAFYVGFHQDFAADMAEHEGESAAVVDWLRRHDRHEGIIGDIPGPLTTLLRTYTPVLDAIKVRLDIALCAAEGIRYPHHMIRQQAHYWDKIAETIEWRAVLGQPERPWTMKMNDEQYLRRSTLALWWKNHQDQHPVP